MGFVSTRMDMTGLIFELCHPKFENEYNFQDMILTLFHTSSGMTLSHEGGHYGQDGF